MGGVLAAGVPGGSRLKAVHPSLGQCSGIAWKIGLNGSCQRYILKRHQSRRMSVAADWNHHPDTDPGVFMLLSYI